MSLQSPVEIGLGEYMGRFYAQLIADTPSMEEYIARGLSQSIAWVPGKMIDQVEDMLAEWRKNQNEDSPGMSSFMPVTLVCMSKDFIPATPDFGIAVGTAIDVTNPDDPYGRNYKVRLSVNEYRAQIVFMSSEKHSAHSLAMQFNIFANEVNGRRFKHIHTFAGSEHSYGAVLEQIDIGAVSSQTDQKNITILVADLNIRATVPIFQAPKANEPNDGKPAPAGYPVVLGTTSYDQVSKVGSDTSLDADGNPVQVFQ